MEGAPKKKSLEKDPRAKLRALIGAFGLGAAVLASKGEHHDHSSLVDTARQWTHSDAESVSEKLEQDIGYDLSKIAQKNGYNADLWVRAPHDRPYIVVIGQTHFIEESGGMTAPVGEIKESQMHIESIIVDMVKAEQQKKKVYIEGSTSDSNEVELVNTVRDGLDNIKPHTGDYEQLARIYQQIKGHSREDATLCAISHAFRNKLAKLTAHYSEHPSDFTPTDQYQTLAEAYGWTEKRITSSFFEQYGMDANYLAGAPIKLALEGLINIAPAETSEGNNAALRIADPDIATSREVTDDREDIAIELAATDDTGDEKTRVVVFGSRHDFRDNVQKFNKEHPGEQVGLITLEAKERN